MIIKIMCLWAKDGSSQLSDSNCSPKFDKYILMKFGTGALLGNWDFGKMVMRLG